jgi:hypothetical protein
VATQVHQVSVVHQVEADTQVNQSLFKVQLRTLLYYHLVNLQDIYILFYLLVVDIMQVMVH